MAKNDVFEMALDLMIEEAVCIVNENEGKAIEMPEKREFSEEHNLKMKKLFNKLKREELKLKLVKYSKRVACICLIAIIATGASICSVEAWRRNVINFFYDKDALNSKYNSVETRKISYKDSDISLDYLPVGFEVKKSTVSENVVCQLFEKEDLYFMISVITVGGQGSIDTEDATIRTVDIDGNEAVLIEKDDICQILWQDGEYEFHIAGNINSEEILKIAKNMQKI